MTLIFARYKRPHLRLLPSVMLVCGGLLVLNATGIVREALAGPGAAAPADAMGPAPVPGNKDYAGNDGEIASAAEVDVLTSLSKRRNELDARAAQIQIQSNILAATETRVDSKIAQLKQLQAQIAGLLVQRDAAQKIQIASLTKTYAAMKPASAARIFDSLSDEVLVPVAENMKSDVLAPILAAMSADRAQKLTMKLASKLTLPDAAPDMAPPPAPLPPVPGPAAAAAPAPQPQAAAPAQTASAAPAPKPAAAPAPTPAPAPKPGN